MAHSISLFIIVFQTSKRDIDKFQKLITQNKSSPLNSFFSSPET